MDSVKSAIFDDDGEEGLNDPAASTPDDASEANEMEEMMPDRNRNG